MQVDCFIFNVFSYDMKNYFTIFVEFLKDFNEFFRCKLGVALELQHTECFFAFHSVCLQDHNNSYIAQNSLLILCTSPTHARFGAARRLAKNSNWSLHALNRCNMENKQELDKRNQFGTIKSPKTEIKAFLLTAHRNFRFCGDFSKNNKP